MKVDTSAKIPIKMWLDGIAPGQGWDDCMDQFRNVANLPVATKWVAAMPDAHLGFGMPIGGVLATEGAVVPGAIGVDIGCGMVAARFDIEAASISKEQLQAIRMAIHARVPVGGGGGRGRKSSKRRSTHPEGWHKEPQPWGRLPRLPAEAAHSGSIVAQEFEKARLQVGTLGGGNHFIELQVDEDGKLWVMLHSGSRNVGLRVANHFVKVAQAFCKQWYTPLADDKLAFLVKVVPEYKAYIDQMNWCLKFAEVSRSMMLAATTLAIREVTGVALYDRTMLQLDTHHNFAAMENHYGRNLLVHRKGAVKASGLVTMPGSMQTASYIGRGLEPKESFNTCAHGAGRVMSRTAANKKFDLAFAQDAMKDVVFNVRDGDFDELGDAYKDIHAVMAAQKDLVRPEYRLTPLAVVKG